MTSDEQTGTGEDGHLPDAGGSTDQNVSGLEETGTFLTDEPPTSGTPSHGSGNAGVNRAGGNRPGFTDDALRGRGPSEG